MRLAGKVAVITGSGSGMGKAMAELFAAEGVRVVCADISGRQNEVSAAIGDAAIAVHADVSDEADVRSMIGAAEQKFGRLDILVNNAGFGAKMAPLHEQTAESWDRVHAVNIRGVFLCMKYGIVSMPKGGGGSIVNIASPPASSAGSTTASMARRKAGVNQLTKSGALDYAAHNIRINAIEPGTIWTGLVAQSKVHPEPPPDAPRLAGIPLDRWGLAREIAAAALFLASDEAPYVTGVLLPVDGGYCIGFSGMGAENSGAPRR